MVGPGWYDRWVYWKYQTPEQRIRAFIKSELDKILASSYYNGHPPSLAPDEVTAVRKNLQNQDVETDADAIKQVWFLLFRQHFLRNSLNRANDCRRAFYLYNQGMDAEINCNDVVLFWRIQKMMSSTANALRQQIMNIESRRLEREIKETLDDFSQDQEKKETLLTGRRVQVAEELKRVRQIQEKLEEFIAALNSEK